jgi:elongation factor G
VFENALLAGTIPDRFIAPIQEGIEEACARGVLAGYPIRDARIALCDGAYHDVDSTARVVRAAAAMAFEDAARKAGPVIFEPVMRVEVVTPREHMAEVIGGLVGRRGEIRSCDASGDRRIVLALVPLAELFGYATSLRATTRGRATCSERLDRFQEVRVDPGSSDDDRTSPVSAPLRPVPSLNEGAVALPEPDDDPPEP